MYMDNHKVYALNTIIRQFTHTKYKMRHLAIFFPHSRGQQIFYNTHTHTHISLYISIYYTHILND